MMSFFRTAHKEMDSDIDSAEVPVGFDDMNLNMFMLWCESALKSFLALCSKNTEGDFSTLAARAFNAYDERIPVDPDKEARHRRLQEFYKDKLKLPARFPSAGPTAIAEPFTLKVDGWGRLKVFKYGQQ